MCTERHAVIFIFTQKLLILHTMKETSYKEKNLKKQNKKKLPILLGHSAMPFSFQLNTDFCLRILYVCQKDSAIH